jgi:hypothetical protein
MNDFITSIRRQRRSGTDRSAYIVAAGMRAFGIWSGWFLHIVTVDTGTAA